MISTLPPSPQVIAANRRVAAANLQRHAAEEEEQAATWRGFFLYDLGMLHAARELLTRVFDSSSEPTRHFLHQSIRAVEKEARTSLNYWLEASGGLAPTSSSSHGQTA